MRKSKLVITMLIISLLLMISGCNKSVSVDNPKDLTTSPSPTSSITVAPTITPTIEPTLTPTITPTIVPTLTPEDLSMEAYKKFMKNEARISFDRFMPKDPNDYNEGALYKKGREYKLSEVLDIIIAHYIKQRFTNTKIKYIDYSYIDCGKDGVNELVLRFNGMDLYDPDDDSTLVYVIKYIDGKLSLCYCYETWARCDASINEYGYYQSAGSSGASNHGNNYGLIDKNGNWKPIVDIESETDIRQLTLPGNDELGQIPNIAEAKGISDGIEVDTIRFNDEGNYTYKSEEVDNKDCFYTFYVYDDNSNLVKDANLYTNSVYQEIFDEAKVPFITPDELTTMISEKEKKVGATAEIKKGKKIIWKTLNGTMFSDYVGR